MEFLLPILPVVGAAVIVFLLMFLVAFIAKLCKFDLKFPYGRVSLAVIVLTIVFSAYKVITSPITRPVITEVKNDIGQYQVPQDTLLVLPVAKDNSFEPEFVDTSVTDNAKIKDHNDL